MERLRLRIERLISPEENSVWLYRFCADCGGRGRPPLLRSLAETLRLRMPGFRALAFAMLRRTLELAWFHLPGAEIDWQFRPLLAHASQVKITSADLRWQEWQRYSNRQQRKISLDGFVGKMELEGDLSPFGPLLRAAEVLHLGKGATFGLGRVKVNPVL